MRSTPPHHPVGRARTPFVALAAAASLALAGCTAEEPLPSPSDSVTEVPPTTAAPAPSTTATPSSSPSPSRSATPSSPPTPSASPTGVAVGGLVDGFPTDVVAVPPGADVTLSNVVDDEGGGRTVALAGRTSSGAADLVAFYTQSLTGQGFTATTPPAVDGAVVTTFTRGGAAELLTLSVTSTDGQQDFSIGGTLS